MAGAETPQREGLAPGEGPTPDAPQGGPDGARPEAQDQELPDLDALLDRYDPEVLRKNRKLMGIAGSLADRLATQRAQALAAQQAEALVRERMASAEADRSRLRALEAARRGDFKGLGEMRAREVLQEDQQRHVDGFKTQATARVYGSVQSAVDQIAKSFPDEVIAAAATKMGELPQNLSWEEGFQRWLPALIEARAEHLMTQPESRKKIEQEISPALRSRLIAEMNGTEPVADSGSGRAQSVRQITDEQIAAMSPEEWVQVYDVKAGKFKPGNVYKPTRAMDIAAMRVVGRGA